MKRIRVLARGACAAELLAMATIAGAGEVAYTPAAFEHAPGRRHPTVVHFAPRGAPRARCKSRSSTRS
jgi:hypothetical protein